MALKRRTQPEPAAPRLCPSVAGILLGGWSARPLGTGDGDDDGVFDLFTQRDRAIVQRWREHRAWLLEQAAAHGIEPAWTCSDGTGPYYFGEYLERDPLLRKWAAQRGDSNEDE